MKLKINNDESYDLLGLSKPDFPKYTSQLMNLANQNSQATRPKNVGQLSDMINQFPGGRVGDWETWYMNQMPKAIELAVEKIKNMLSNFKKALSEINSSLIEEWLFDLIITKTFFGLKIQDMILQKISNEFALYTRNSSSEEESKGIDGYINEIPVQIKPETYKQKKSLPENIKYPIIIYEKGKKDVKFDVPDDLVKKFRSFQPS